MLPSLIVACDGGKRQLAEVNPKMPADDKSMAQSAAMRVATFIDGTTVRFGMIVALSGVVLLSVVLADVAARFGGGRSTTWAGDLTYMIFGAYTMLGAAYTLKNKGHIRTDLIYNTLSERQQAIIDFVGYIIFFYPIMIIFLYYGLDSFVRSWNLGERAITSPWRPLLWPFRAILPMACILLILQGTSEVIKCCYAIRNGRWP